ncbi:hypothetical protein GCM10007881_26050 [Mesorhizobium huakuii]|nr:hypothetical protein GCM10007881_26050 [Mesorhizobium huakuii]
MARPGKVAAKRSERGQRDARRFPLNFVEAEPFPRSVSGFARAKVPGRATGLARPSDPHKGEVGSEPFPICDKSAVPPAGKTPLHPPPRGEGRCEAAGWGQRALQELEAGAASGE